MWVSCLSGYLQLYYHYRVVCAASLHWSSWTNLQLSFEKLTTDPTSHSKSQLGRRDCFIIQWCKYQQLWLRILWVSSLKGWMLKCMNNWVMVWFDKVNAYHLYLSNWIFYENTKLQQMMSMHMKGTWTKVPFQTTNSILGAVHRVT